MDKLFLQKQIGNIDKQTLVDEGITSLELMERAARSISQYILLNRSFRPILVVVGGGNNGGDGLALARMLSNNGWPVKVHALRGPNDKVTADNRTNFVRLQETNAEITIGAESVAPDLQPNTMVIDALFGTGLSRSVEGLAARWIEEINASGCEVLSIDVPSGLGNEEQLSDIESRTVVRALNTISFEFPKVPFFLPECEKYVGDWHITDIALSVKAIKNEPTDLYYTSKGYETKLRPRSRFGHKGTFGRALLLAGQKGMMGAAVLAARGCTSHGVGMLTVAVPQCGYNIIQTAVPEAMALCSSSCDVLSWNEKIGTSRADAVGIGPGLGRTPLARQTVEQAIAAFGSDKPMVIDADGLFHLAAILEENPDYRLPRQCVITPHVVEFDRLTKPHTSSWQRMKTARQFAVEHNTTVVLKGAYTMTATSDGRMVFNTTGNSGMATAGSGDVLTGIVLALLAQGYAPDEAGVLGVALHAAAGDRAAENFGEMGVTASRMVGLP